MATLQLAAQRKTNPPGALLRTLGLLYALAAFVAALALFLYAVPFLGNLRFLKRAIVNPTIDIGPSTPVSWAILVDGGLILLFGLQHSLMARGGFKRWLARNIPGGLERATYVHASNLALWPVLLLWQPIPAVLVDLSAVRPLMTAIYWAGWLIVLLSSLNIDLLELWGLRQAWSWSRGEIYRAAALQGELALPPGPPPHLSGAPDRVLGDAPADRRPRAVCRLHERLYFHRRLVRGARPRAQARPILPRLSAQGAAYLPRLVQGPRRT